MASCSGDPTYPEWTKKILESTFAVLCQALYGAHTGSICLEPWRRPRYLEHKTLRGALENWPKLDLSWKDTLVYLKRVKALSSDKVASLRTVFSVLSSEILFPFGNRGQFYFYSTCF